MRKLILRTFYMYYFISNIHKMANRKKNRNENSATKMILTIII